MSAFSGDRSRPSSAANWWAFVHANPTEASCKRDHAPKNALVRLDARLLDYLRPLRNLRLDDRGESTGRVADSFETKIGEFGAQVRLRERLDGFEMELADDRRCRMSRGGRIRNPGVTSLQRWPLFAEYPTLNESGVPGYELLIWNGIVVRAGTP